LSGGTRTGSAGYGYVSVGNGSPGIVGASSVDDSESLYVKGRVELDGNLFRSVTTGITAGTTQSQANATALTADINIVSTVGTTNDGVKLPSAAAGMIIYVINQGANTLKLYPASGGTIAGVAPDAAVTVAATAMNICVASSTTAWECQVTAREN
jgi:hypothetical protein